MSYSNKYKLYFVHIPKNGGTTIESNLGLTPPGHDHWDRCASKHKKQWADFHKFAVVRDPIDRFISNYKYARMDKSHYHSSDGKSKYGKHPDFDFCSTHELDDAVIALCSGTHRFGHPGWKHQTPYIFDQSDQIQVDEVLTMQDINPFISRYISMAPEIKNVSKEISQTLSNDSQDMLRKYYERDFRLLAKFLEK